MTSCSYGYVFLVRKVNSEEHYLVIALRAQPTGVKKNDKYKLYSF